MDQHEITHLHKLLQVRRPIPGLDVKHLVNVLCGLNAGKDLEVVQGQLRGDLGGVELEQVDLCLLDQFPAQLVRNERLRVHIVLKVIPEYTWNSTPG